jgi:AcrR family transcriptional regulator
MNDKTRKLAGRTIRGSRSKATKEAAPGPERSRASLGPAASTPRPSCNLLVRPFGDVLKQRQLEAGEKRKGERTRDNLKLAAIEALERTGYHKLTVADICTRAGASHAAFYLYFKDKNDITHQVLSEFMEEIFAQARSSDRGDSAFDSIYSTNLLWLRAAKANAGLMRCVLQLSDDTQQFKEFRESTDARWFAHVSRSIAKRWLGNQIDEKALLLTVYALGSMTDEFIRRILVSGDPHLQELVNDAAPTEEALAHFLTTLWFRALFGADSLTAPP